MKIDMVGAFKETLLLLHKDAQRGITLAYKFWNEMSLVKYAKEYER
jgi:hypothetical protein